MGYNFNGHVFGKWREVLEVKIRVCKRKGCGAQLMEENGHRFGSAFVNTCKNHQLYKSEKGTNNVKGLRLARLFKDPERQVSGWGAMKNAY